MIKFNKHPCILSSYISQSFPFAADSTEKESRDKFWAEFFKLFCMNGNPILLNAVDFKYVIFRKTLS